jgi:hypothetical protein
MKIAIAAAALAVGLGACTQTAEIDAGIQSSLAAICPIADQAHAAFLAVNMTGKFDKYADEERQAYAALRPACLNPSAVNLQNIGVYIGAAYVAWEMAGVI